MILSGMKRPLLHWTGCLVLPFWESRRREGAGGPTGLDSKSTFSSVLLSEFNHLTCYCLEMEDQLTSYLLTEQFSPLLKASFMPMHVWLLPAPRHLCIFKHVSNSQKSRTLLTCLECSQD